MSFDEPSQHPMSSQSPPALGRCFRLGLQPLALKTTSRRAGHEQSASKAFGKPTVREIQGLGARVRWGRCR
jgi:hypothetical protein